MNILNTGERQFVEDVKEVATALRDIRIVENVLMEEDFLGFQELRDLLKEKKEAIISLFAKDLVR